MQSNERRTITHSALVLPAGAAEQACLVSIYPPGPLLGRRFDLRDGPAVIGRAPDVDVVLERDFISRHHARVERRPEGWAIADLSSKNGSYVNGVRVSDHLLEDGDLVVVGDSILKFLTGSSVELAYHKELYRLTVVDDLTHTYNKRYFLEQLERELSLAARFDRPLSLAIMDIDHFKEVNDTFGHLVGDQLLQDLAGRLLRRVRKGDLVARYGGEEFAVLLVQTANSAAQQAAERLRRLMADQPFIAASHPIRLTISLGVATAVSGQSGEDLIARADSNLYRAKREGRDRVVG